MRRDAGQVGHLSLLDRLPYARQLELERRDPQARHASLLALGLVLDGLASVRGRAVEVGELQFPQGGKPRCTGGESFSISHATQRVAVAVSGDCGVGIDVEEFGPAKAPGADAWQKLEHWTAVEAVLKVAEVGLRHAHEVQVDLAASRARLGDHVYFLRRLELGSGVVAHLATTAPVESLQSG